MSGVSSRYVTGLGAVILGIMAFFPKFSSVLALVPGPVLGGVMLVTLGSVAANGIHVISMGPMTRRNITILAVAIAIGIGGYYADQLGYLAFMSTSIKTIFTGISGTALTALLLNMILPQAEKIGRTTKNLQKHWVYMKDKHIERKGCAINNFQQRLCRA